MHLLCGFQHIRVHPANIYCIRLFDKRRRNSCVVPNCQQAAMYTKSFVQFCLVVFKVFEYGFDTYVFAVCSNSCHVYVVYIPKSMYNIIISLPFCSTAPILMEICNLEK